MWLICGPGPARSAAEPEEPEISAGVADAVERGLRYLEHEQLKSGAWRGHIGYKLRQDYQVTAASAPHIGVTALAGLAFLAGGHVPGRGAHGDSLERAALYVLDHVNEFGFISDHGTRMYSHAFATLFLAELCGMYRHPPLRDKLQAAVDLIVDAQNEDGSWRYQPFVWQSDMSVAVCQLMALRAAHDIGIVVPRSTMERAVSYVDDSQVRTLDEASFGRDPVSYYASAPGAFRYQVYGDQRSSFALTAAGITSLYHSGRYDVAGLRQSLRFLEQSQDLASRWQGHYFYYYGHYYAVQAMFISGRDPGTRHDYWQAYWSRTSRELLLSQEEDGSWPNPVGPGPSFATAVALIVLQAPNRYLPILQR